MNTPCPNPGRPAPPPDTRLPAGADAASIDWNERWKRAFARRWRGREDRLSYWNRRAASFAQRSDDSAYSRTILAAMAPEPHWSVLDVGCGSGALALPLARRVREVTALDFSEGMLEQLSRRGRQRGISNLRTVHAAWEDDWDQAGVGTHDVAIASRSMVVEDLEGALRKLDQAARKRVFITSTVGDGPRDRRALEAVGRPCLGGPDYIYIINLLHQLGIYANLAILDADAEWAFGSPGEARAYYEQTLEDLDAAEHARLLAYIAEELVPRDGKWVMPNRKPIRWALIWWSKDSSPPPDRV